MPIIKDRELCRKRAERKTNVGETRQEDIKHLEEEQERTRERIKRFWKAKKKPIP